MGRRRGRIWTLIVEFVREDRSKFWPTVEGVLRHYLAWSIWVDEISVA